MTQYRDIISKQILDGDLRAVSRSITLCENRSDRSANILGDIYSSTGNAYVVGVTGAPGAGKSTLVDELAIEWRRKGKKVAIVAVDPTSPFTGGAILGDRIRMAKTVEDPGVYIRSIATRGSLGGLSRATIDIIQILDAAKFDVILIETVGVGQAEVDIVKIAHTCLVVLVPGMGDGVQIIKAGIIEIADLFVINKADRDGSDLLQKELRVLLSLSDHGQNDWIPKILTTIATKGDGVLKLVEASEEHKNWLSQSGKGLEKKKTVIKDQITKLVTTEILSRIISQNTKQIDKLVENCIDKKLDPYSVARKLIEENFPQDVGI